MKKYLVFLFFLLAVQRSSAQAIKPLAQTIYAKQLSGVEFFSVNVFKPAPASELMGIALPENLHAQLLKFDPTTVSQLLLTQPENISFNIPVTGGSPIVLKLFKASVITNDFLLNASEGSKQVNVFSTGLHYRGIVDGNTNSLAAVSIFSDGVMGLVATENGNFNLGKVKESNNFYVYYNDINIAAPFNFSCGTTSKERAYTADQLKRSPSAQTTKCVRLYWEISNDIYLDQGGFAATTNFSLGLFNQTAVIFANDGISVSLSELFIWTTASPYSGSSSFDYLDGFQNFRPFFNGDLGHLLNYSNFGGVAATIDGICAFNQDNRHCYSGISAGYSVVPVYSWAVNVTTHEQGHLMGSFHTHACVWNGNGTAIDGCGPSQGYVEGNCPQAPFPTNGGTIMSYCHLVGVVGVNFVNGFGLQPANAIINTINTASCLTPCSTINCVIPSGLTVTNVTTTSATLSWIIHPNSSEYIIEINEVGTSVWDTILATSSPITINNLNPGANYNWQIQALCAEGLTFFSPPSWFQTPPVSCAPPSSLSAANINSTSAVLSWQAVVGAAYYIVSYSLSGSGITEVDTISATSYLAVNLVPGSAYDYLVTTVCTGGANSASSTLFGFNTAAVGAIVTTIIQPDASCAKDALIKRCLSCGTDSLNYGTSPGFVAEGWDINGDPIISRSILQFDVTAIPVNSVIQSAFLSLYFDPSGVNGYQAGKNNGLVIKATSPWEENTVSWASQPNTTIVQNAAIPISVLPTQDYPAINIKNMIQYFVNNPDKNSGMIIKLINEVPYNRLVLASSDYSDASRHPRLLINYTPAVDSCRSLRYAACNGEDVMLTSCIPCGYDSVNNGETGEIDAIAWTDNGNAVNSRSLLRWDLSFIPTNAVVTNASLSLYAYNSPINGEHSTLSGSNEVVLNKVTSPWNEYSVSWSTMPSVTSANQVMLPASTSSSQNYLNTDVTALVQDMVTNPATNYGLMMQLVAEQSFRKMVFASSDNGDPAKHPLLKVCYYVPVKVNEIAGQGIVEVKQMENAILIQSPVVFGANMQFRIFSVSGQLVKNVQDVKGNTAVINTSALSSGIYLYTFTDDGVSLTGKFVVNK